MRIITTIAVGALIITGIALWIGLGSESGNGDEEFGPAPESSSDANAHLRGREGVQEAPPSDEPDAAQIEPPLDELAAFLSGTLASASSKVRQDPTWLREKSKAMPGGMPTLIKLLFSGQDLSEEMEGLVNGLGFQALAGAGKERIRILRPTVVQAFEGMGSPTVAAWRIGRDWMSYLRVKRDMFSSLYLLFLYPEVVNLGKYINSSTILSTNSIFISIGTNR